MPNDPRQSETTRWQPIATVPSEHEAPRVWLRDVEGTEAICARVRFNRSGWAVPGSRREIYPVQWASLTEVEHAR